MKLDLHPLAGIYVASVTPLSKFDTLDLPAIEALMTFYAKRGCHGSLLLGTTGEGTSMSGDERIAFWNEAIKVREEFPDFRLLAATGTPSLMESIALTKRAFVDGMDAVVVLPPYYFRKASDDGLFEWFSKLIEKAVPQDKYLLGYHIPQVSGLGLSANLLSRLNEKFPKRFGGLKDSSGDLAHAQEMVELLPGKSVLVGNDHLLAPALSIGASGAITALANLSSPLLRMIWDAHQKGFETETLQDNLSRLRNVLDQNPDAQSFLKGLLSSLHDFPNWPVRAPLQSFKSEKIKALGKIFEDASR